MGVAAQAQAGPVLCAYPTPSLLRSANPGIFYEHQSSTVTIKLSNPSCTTVSVTVSTAPDTAQPWQDYVPVTKTLVFSPGETSKSVTIYGVDDTVQEGVKWFKIPLTSVKGATPPSSTGLLAVEGVEAQ
ncbi:MAG: Calx-beta domain-containing protein [Acidimicrobiales bacterium]